MVFAVCGRVGCDCLMLAVRCDPTLTAVNNCMSLVVERGFPCCPMERKSHLSFLPAGEAF